MTIIYVIWSQVKHHKKLIIYVRRNGLRHSFVPHGTAVDA